MKAIAFCACLLLVSPGLLCAQEKEKETTAERLKLLEERIRVLEEEILALKAAPGAAAAPAPAAVPQVPAAPPVITTTTTAGQLPVYGGAAAAAKALNPDISVIGDFLGSAGKNRIRPVPALELHETEVGLQAIIDPYARGDFFLSFGESGVSVEEGYLTFTALPAGFVAKLGKMRAAFGKVNTIHNHALEWTDRPLVTENLVGGEDGISDAGLSISRILPAPNGIFLEATGQAYRGDSSDLFKASQRKDVSYVAHLRGYKDLTESTNIDLGFSYARGHNEVGSAFHTQLYGIDATLRWRPLRRAIYHSFLARTEIVWSDREQLPSVLLRGTQKAFGFYTSAEYRLSRRWTVGGRFDRSGRAREANQTDQGFSALLTYWPSEFSQVRGQYRLVRYAEGKTGDELRFQFLFVLGAHGAHPF
jgi:hypothetical protein